MAKLDKKGLDELWKKFSDDPDSLNVNQYKSILDSAQDLFRKEEITKEEAQNMITAASKYC